MPKYSKSKNKDMSDKPKTESKVCKKCGNTDCFVTDKIFVGKHETKFIKRENKKDISIRVPVLKSRKRCVKCGDKE
jgi:predicted nucleic-acid-binding Zn-ribbon protein